MSTEPTANILIVDDDRKTLLGMEAMLSGPGRRIVLAPSGREALRCLLRENFSLILMDVRMPDMDGFETADLVRENNRLRHIPIIFLSAIDTLETDVYRGAAKGAVDYLFKPVVPEVLKSKVAVFVELFYSHEKLKQKAVQQSEERFRLLVESVQDYAIFMLSPDGFVTSWNDGAEKIKGYRHEEIIGQSFSHFYTSTDQAEGLASQALEKAAREGRCEQEGWRVRRDGGRFWANVVISALLDEKKSPIGFSVVTRDLTDRMRVEEVLRESEAKLRRQAQELEQQLIASGRLVSLGVITASMAHEFNNPLGIVIGFTEALLSDANRSSEDYEALKIIDEETRRCQRIIQELLQFARPRNADFCPTNIKTIVEKILNMAAARMHRQKVQSHVLVEEKLPLISADPQQLEQVLINLFFNAIDAMPNGGDIFVEAAVQPRNGNIPFMEISVRDTGTGIDETDLAKIFQPFFSAKKAKGIGLGLSICERIIQNHGGYIGVQSEAGKGTVFSIALPIKQRSNEDSTVTPSAELNLPK